MRQYSPDRTEQWKLARGRRRGFSSTEHRGAARLLLAVGLAYLLIRMLAGLAG